MNLRLLYCTAKLSFVVCTIILLSACGTFRSAKGIYIDPKFDSYVQLFENTYGIEVNVSIVFKDIADEDVAGQCWYYTNRPRMIEIDTPYWNIISEAGREQLIMHELGHCVLDLDHDDRVGTVGAWNNVPLSIMNSTHFGDEPYYSQNREYYLQELGHGLERHYHSDFTR